MLNLAITTTCNLKCTSCNSYSNLNIHNTPQTIDKIKEGLEYWKGKINAKRFQIVGGEPLLHKQLDTILYLSREAFPTSNIRLFTNGLLLGKNKYIKQALKDTETILTISVHSKEERYLKTLKNSIYNFLDSPIGTEEEAIVSFGKQTRVDGISIELRNITQHWVKLFKNELSPYNSDYKKAHKACLWNGCRTIYNNTLYKCPNTAFLEQLLEKANKEEWEPYYNMYKPLKKDSSEQEIKEWFSIADKPEKVCSMCFDEATFVDKTIW